MRFPLLILFILAISASWGPEKARANIGASFGAGFGSGLHGPSHSDSGVNDHEIYDQTYQESIAINQSTYKLFYYFFKKDKFIQRNGENFFFSLLERKPVSVSQEVFRSWLASGSRRNIFIVSKEFGKDSFKSMERMQLLRNSLQLQPLVFQWNKQDFFSYERRRAFMYADALSNQLKQLQSYLPKQEVRPRILYAEGVNVSMVEGAVHSAKNQFIPGLFDRVVLHYQTKDTLLLGLNYQAHFKDKKQIFNWNWVGPIASQAEAFILYSIPNNRKFNLASWNQWMEYSKGVKAQFIDITLLEFSITGRSMPLFMKGLLSMQGDWKKTPGLVKLGPNHWRMEKK